MASSPVLPSDFLFTYEPLELFLLDQYEMHGISKEYLLEEPSLGSQAEQYNVISHYLEKFEAKEDSAIQTFKAILHFFQHKKYLLNR